MPWSEIERLQAEHETLGLYLTGHPASQYCQELQAFVQPIAQLDPLRMKKVWICGLITTLRRVQTKRGKKLMIIGLEDATAKLDVVVFSEIYESFDLKLQRGHMFVIEGEIARDEYNDGLKMLANQIYSIEAARTRFAKCLILRLTEEHE